MAEIRTGRRVILNDGTIIEDGGAGYDSGILWVHFTGYTMEQTASLFFDNKKTQKIIFQYGEMQDEYEEFTNCFSIQIDMDGVTYVGLKQNADNA